MLLCAIIEAPFIKMQPTDTKRRKVGKGAVKKFNDETVSTASWEKSKLIYLHTSNVLSFCYYSGIDI